MIRPRVLAALVASVFLTLPGARGAAVAGQTVPAGDAEARAASTIRVATYNIQAGVSTATFERVVGEMMPRADVIGLQEINSREKEEVLAELSDNGWDYYRPARFQGEQNPIMWDADRFSLVEARSVRTSGETFIGDESHAKGSMMEAHFVSVVRLEDSATSEVFTVISVHLPPGAVKGGRPAPGRPLLYDRYIAELAATARVAAAEGARGRAFVTGDYNSGWVADNKYRLKRLPIRTFQRTSMVSMWATERPGGDVGTHADALIDQVFSQQRALSAAVVATVKGSDHYPAVATYPAGAPTS